MEDRLKEAESIITRTMEKLSTLKTLVLGSATTENAPEHLRADLKAEDLWGLGSILGDILENLGSAIEKLEESKEGGADG
nr:hypothetical protein 6 [Desulfobacteraceae bacterium]